MIKDGEAVLYSADGEEVASVDAEDLELDAVKFRPYKEVEIECWTCSDCIMGALTCLHCRPDEDDDVC